MSQLAVSVPIPAAGPGPAQPSPAPPWFAVHVRPRHERTAETALSNKGLQCFLPVYPSRRRWSDRSKNLLLPLFPGYLFCRLETRDRLRVETTPSVLTIVGSAGRPLPVPEAEVSAIQALLASGRPVLPHPYVHEGDFVYIHRGPLQGLEGILLQVKNIWRVVVSVTILQRSVSVEVDRDCVSPSPNYRRYATN